MTLRQRIAAQARALLQRLPNAAEQPAQPSLPTAGQAPLVCWLCNDRTQPCRRPDCPKVWRLKDCPALSTEVKRKKP